MLRLQQTLSPAAVVLTAPCDAFLECGSLACRKTSTQITSQHDSLKYVETMGAGMGSTESPKFRAYISK